jgi:hypothetical protein
MTQNWINRQKQQTASNRGVKYGYRSGLEKKIATQIEKNNLPIIFESDKIPYVLPSRGSKYCPDFKLPKKGGFFYLESKGRFVTADRQKHILIKQQHPEIDIRFVFSNQNAKLYKGSKTTYASWCSKNGFQFAHKWIPQDWLDESLR